MTLSIIIVNYNTGALTSACITSILHQQLKESFEIIVVDNASKDNSVSFLRSDFPEIKVIANPQNVGLAAGVNRAIREAHGKYYLILNPDIVVLPQAIKQLLSFMEKNPDVGMAGGKLLSPNGKLQYSCYRFYRIPTIIYRRTALGRTQWGKAETDRFLMKDFDHTSVKAVDWLMGACLIVRADAVKKVGGMDEHFFLYFEDVDWSRRFWEKGYKVMYVPQAQFSHYHQRSSEQVSITKIFRNKAIRHHILSAFKYFWKYKGKELPHRA